MYAHVLSFHAHKTVTLSVPATSVHASGGGYAQIHIKLLRKLKKKKKKVLEVCLVPSLFSKWCTVKCLPNMQCMSESLLSHTLSSYFLLLQPLPCPT